MDQWLGFASLGNKLKIAIETYKVKNILVILFKTLLNVTVYKWHELLYHFQLFAMYINVYLCR